MHLQPVQVFLHHQGRGLAPLAPLQLAGPARYDLLLLLLLVAVVCRLLGGAAGLS
jgi:hypothetical protein